MSTRKYMFQGNLALNQDDFAQQGVVSRSGFVVIDGGLSLHSVATSVVYPLDGRENLNSDFNVAVKSRIKTRIFVLVTVAMIAIASFVLVNSFAQRTQAYSNISYSKAVVQPGDSLWSIASSHRVKGLQTAEVASLIEKRNNLSSGSLKVGDILLLPDSQNAVH